MYLLRMELTSTLKMIMATHRSSSLHHQMVCMTFLLRSEMKYVFLRKRREMKFIFFRKVVIYIFFKFHNFPEEITSPVTEVSRKTYILLRFKLGNRRNVSIIQFQLFTLTNCFSLHSIEKINT